MTTNGLVGAIAWRKLGVEPETILASLTTRTLRQKWRGRDRWVSDGGPRGAGRLVARTTRDDVLLYFQYYHPASTRCWLPLGAYDEAGQRGLSLPQARDRAAELSGLYRSGITNLHEHFERERAEKERKRCAEEEAARRAEADKQRGTLRQLLAAYLAQLERQGRQSSRDVGSIFGKHVLEADPDLAECKAAELSVDDFVGLIGRLVEKGKGRTADKLRSYLRAAYQLAVESKTNPSAPLALRAYGIRVNPIASIGALSQFNRARDRVLSAPELGAFLRRVDALADGAQKDALRLCLLLGGQRPMQLLRMRPADVDLAAGTVTMYDRKGARTQPRRHVLPLVKEAATILKRRINALEEGEPLFSTDKTTPMRHETVSVLVADLARKMIAADPHEAREVFQLRDLRRTCETMLASLKVSSDVRAQLQSHGLGGIQQRHYDRHDYALEKRQALEKWARHLARLQTGEGADVVPMRKRRTERDATRL